MSSLTAIPETPYCSRKRDRSIDVASMERSSTKRRLFSNDDEKGSSQRIQEIYNASYSPAQSPTFDPPLSPESYSHGENVLFNPAIEQVWDNHPTALPPLESPFLSPARGAETSFVPDNWSLPDDWSLSEEEDTADSLLTPSRTPPLTSKPTMPETPWIQRQPTLSIPEGCEEYEEYIESAQKISSKLFLLQQSGEAFEIKLCDIPIHGEVSASISQYSQYLGKGKYHEAHLVKGYIPNLGWTEPREFVIKHLYKPKHLQKPKEVVHLFETTQSEYPKIREALEDSAHVRVACHYDLDLLAQAGSDVKPCHGCQLVEYIPDGLPEKLDEPLSLKVKEMFQLFYQHQNLQVDLQKENIQLGCDGKLVLIDPVHPLDPFQYTIEQSLDTFAKNDPKLMKDLDPRPPAEESSF